MKGSVSMAKYTFIKHRDPSNKYDISDITMELDSVILPDMLNEFKLFLIASGFVIRGDIMIEEPQDD